MAGAGESGRDPLVSCVVPVFNGERYLAEAVDSIVQQTYRCVEILIVDDGSTDRTPEIIASFGFPVRVLQQANAGPAAARNRGVAAASGEFIAFLDADDRWHPDKLRQQLARFAARPDLDVSVTQVRNFWIAELAEEAARFRDHRIAGPLPGYVAATMLARRNIFERIGPFNTALRFGHSAEWFLRCSAQGGVVEVLAEVLYERRIHHANRSRQLNRASREEFLQLVKAHLDRRRDPSRAAGNVPADRKRDLPL